MTKEEMMNDTLLTAISLLHSSILLVLDIVINITYVGEPTFFVAALVVDRSFILSSLAWVEAL